MKIVTLKISGRFNHDGGDVGYTGEFDEDALEDGPGQALLVYQDGRWHLFTSEEEVDAQGVDDSDHGYMEHTDLFGAIEDAREVLKGKGYEVAFKVHPGDPD
jgi:hypothetical protein